MLSAKAKKLLVLECALLFALSAGLFALMFSRSYIYHFEQVTLNYYANGSADFSTNIAGVVRSLGTIAMFSLVIGATTGAAIGLTCTGHFKPSDSVSEQGRYEAEMTKAGFVVINQTDQGTTYKLTELGRRFLRDYQFLERTEETTI